MVGAIFAWARVTWRHLFSQTDGFDITVSLTLFLLWLVLNMLDIIISLLAIQAGAIEIGLLFQVSGTYLASINKMMLAILIGAILVYSRKNSWLSLLNLGMAGLCIYNGHVLLKLLP